MTNALFELRGRTYISTSPDNSTGFPLRLLSHPQKLAETWCPACHVMDYLPLGNGWRRCWRCGHRWGPAGTTDPGDPPDLARLEALCLDSSCRGGRADRLERDGEEILAALATRGVKVWLGRDGRPRAGPRERLEEADRELLAAHREAVLAALGGRGRDGVFSILETVDARERRHQRWMHGGRPVPWWRRADGGLVCGDCHPPVAANSAPRPMVEVRP